MQAGARWVLAGFGAAGLLAALAWGLTDHSEPLKSQDPDSAPRRSAAQTPRPTQPQTAAAEPPGLQLSGQDGVGRQSTAQAIYRAALLELQRMDSLEEERAREVYLRGRAALERVEDELDQDDEPSHVRLRSDIEALATEMRRLYEQPEP